MLLVSFRLTIDAFYYLSLIPNYTISGIGACILMAILPIMVAYRSGCPTVASASKYSKFWSYTFFAVIILAIDRTVVIVGQWASMKDQLTMVTKIVGEVLDAGHAIDV